VKHFFLSYRRAAQEHENEAELVRTLFNDICAELDSTKPATEIGFLDQRSIKTGGYWDATIEENLRDCCVMVALLSQEYFESQYCAFEFSHFLNSKADLLKQHKLDADLIIPVTWNSLTEVTTSDSGELTTKSVVYPSTIDASYRRIQALVSGRTASQTNAIEAVSQHGLRLATKLKTSPQYLVDYSLLVQAIAEKIRSARERLQKLGIQQWRKTPYSEGVNWKTRHESFESARKYGRKTKTVRVVFFAAQPEEIKPGPDPVRYEDSGQNQWRPFELGEGKFQSIGLTVIEAIEKDAELSFDQIRITQNLLQDIRAAIDENSPLMLVMDPWTVSTLPSYQEHIAGIENLPLSQLGRSSVFVVWPQAEPAVVEDQLKAQVDGRFDARIKHLEKPLKVHHYFGPCAAFKNEFVMVVEQVRSAIRSVVQLPDSPGATDQQFHVLTTPR
jgi:hypothetical protein